MTAGGGSETPRRQYPRIGACSPIDCARRRDRARYPSFRFNNPSNSALRFHTIPRAATRPQSPRDATILIFEVYRSFGVFDLSNTRHHLARAFSGILGGLMTIYLYHARSVPCFSCIRHQSTFGRARGTKSSVPGGFWATSGCRFRLHAH